MLKTPNFFSGQIIDHEDFNRLSRYPKQLQQRVINFLIPTGGILNLGNSLRVEVIDLDKLCVHEGVALQKNGLFISLSEKKIFNLTSLMVGKVYYLYMSFQIVGEDPFENDEDESITGFLSECENAYVFLSSEENSDAIEIARFEISPQGVEVCSEYRNIIEPFFRPLFTREERKIIDEEVAKIEDSIRKLVRLSWCERDYNAFAILTLIRGELVSAFSTEAKLKTYFKELGQKLLWIFDGIRESLPLREVTEQLEQKLANLYLALPGFGKVEALSQFLPLLGEIARAASELVDEIESKFQVLTLLEEELRLKERSYFGFENRILLGGGVLKLIEKIHPGNRERLEVLAPAFNERVLESSFASGEKFQLPGKFISEGLFRLSFQLSVGNKPFVFVMNQYQRRNPLQVEFRLNGEKVSEISNLSFEDQWFRKGIVFPKEKILNGRNLLDIEVKNCDLDFGFFESALYQMEEVRGGS